MAIAAGMQSDLRSLGLDSALLKAGLITRAEQEQIREKRFELDGSLVAVILEMKLLSEEQLRDFLSRRMGFEAPALDGVTVERKVYELIPKAFAIHKRIAPLRFEYDTLVLAMEDPSDSHLIEDLHDRLGFQIKPVAATGRDVDAILEKYPLPQEEIPEALARPRWLRITGALFMPVVLILPIGLVMLLGMQDYFTRVRNAINANVISQWHSNPYEFIVNFCVIYGIWSCAMWLVSGALFPPSKAPLAEE